MTDLDVRPIESVTGTECHSTDAETAEVRYRVSRRGQDELTALRRANLRLVRENELLRTAIESLGEIRF